MDTSSAHAGRVRADIKATLVKHHHVLEAAVLIRRDEQADE
jgi:hypothetical protein